MCKVPPKRLTVCDSMTKNQRNVTVHFAKRVAIHPSHLPSAPVSSRPPVTASALGRGCCRQRCPGAGPQSRTCPSPEPGSPSPSPEPRAPSPEPRGGGGRRGRCGGTTCRGGERQRGRAGQRPPQRRSDSQSRSRAETEAEIQPEPQPEPQPEVEAEPQRQRSPAERIPAAHARCPLPAAP